MISQKTDEPPAASSLLESLNAVLAANDSVTAMRLCEGRLAVVPDDPDAQRYLSQIHAQQGNFEEARKIAHRATEQASNNPRAWSDRGRVHVLSSNLRDAIACFQKAVEVAPNYADGWHNLGLALRQTGQTERAFEALKQALLIDPTRAESYLSLGNLLVDEEQLEEAIGCFERAAAYDPSLAKAHLRLAQEVSQRGEVDRAESLFRRSLTIDPTSIDSWFGLGRTLEDLGQADAALSCYRNVLHRQPGHALALAHYLALAKGDEGGEWLDQLEPALDRADGSMEAKALMGYGLTKWYDRRGQFREAASAGLRANAARQKVAGPFDRENFRNRIDRIIETYTADFFTERKQFGVGTDQPVFIVGLPRSGTTLTEQILSAHPLMHGAGELPDLARLAQQVVAEVEAAPWQAAAQLEDEMEKPPAGP